MSPLVSVVIPTYNHARYVRATLDSVFAQTFSDYEIIVVNDGSPDDTAAVLRPLAEAGKLRYLEQTNAGQAAARNRGITEARGTFLALLDDDDLWPADKLAWQVAALQAHADWVMVGGRAGRVQGDGTLAEPADAAGGTRLASLEEIFEGNPLDSPGQALVRREALVAAGGFDPAIWGSDDWDVWMRLAARGTVALVNRTALYYRLHATNASHAAERMFWSGLRVVGKNLPLLPRARRFTAWRRALYALYLYSGSRVVGALRAGNFRRAAGPAARVLARLAPTMLRDLDLARMVARDLVPARWRTAMPASCSAE